MDKWLITGGEEAAYEKQASVSVLKSPLPVNGVRKLTRMVADGDA